jgi:hypothetical protein
MSSFSEKEKLNFDQIVSLTSLNQSQVRDVLFAILTCASLNAHSQDNEITIPYLCTLKFNYEEITNDKGIESIISIDAEPSATLLKEYVAVKNGEEPITKKYFKRQNRLHFKNMLNIYADE